MRRALLLLGVVMAAAAGPLTAQSVLERSPNLHGVWTLRSGSAVFVFAHRFVFLSGGDELVNFPTLTLGVGLPLGITAGLDYTSNSEIVPTGLAGNETQYWLKRAVEIGGAGTVAGMVAYNTAASSVDGAISGRYVLGPFALLGELRAASSLFGSDEAGASGALGGTVQLTPYLGLTADVGRVLSADTFPATWSAGFAVGIPGSPHTFSLHTANVGAITLQGAAREKVILPAERRYGFTFTVPLGTREQWGRIFRPAPPPPPPAENGTVAARVEARQVVFTPEQVRIRVGESVEWVNLDPLEHTVTAEDESWGSGVLLENERYLRRFDRAGRFAYYCVPHPQMRGVVIVED